MKAPKVICLTPVRNEAWILDRFLKCASTWADVIIIADQNSMDGSKEIALKYEKVKVIENNLNDLDQENHQRLLIEEARKIPGPRILVALDADEALSSNYMHNPEWQTVLGASPGTIIELQWVNILSNFTHYWWPSTSDFHYPIIFVDDDSEYVGQSIHCSRIPEPAFHPKIRLKSIKLLHYSYFELDRSRSKQRWYQCWEVINRPLRSPVWLYRFYNTIEALPHNEIYPLEKRWIVGYEKLGIDMTSVTKDGIYWRDIQVLEWLQKYGVEKFRKISIWDYDWNALNKHINGGNCHFEIRDPRSILNKLIHKYLKETQPSKQSLIVRILDRLLQFIWHL